MKKIITYLTVFSLIITMLAAFSGCGKSNNQSKNENEGETTDTVTEVKDKLVGKWNIYAGDSKEISFFDKYFTIEFKDNGTFVITITPLQYEHEIMSELRLPESASDIILSYERNGYDWNEACEKYAQTQGYKSYSDYMVAYAEKCAKKEGYSSFSEYVKNRDGYEDDLATRWKGNYTVDGSFFTFKFAEFETVEETVYTIDYAEDMVILKSVSNDTSFMYVKLIKE